MKNEPSPTRVVIVDEQSGFCRSMRESLASQPGLSVVGEASDAAAAVQLTRQTRPDILLIDVALCRTLEHRALNGLGSGLEPPRILVMMTAIERACVVEALRFGANGIVLKASHPRVLLQSIRSVMTGHYWLENESIGILVEAFRDSLVPCNDGRSPKDFGLTRREVDIMTKVANGSSNREVSEEFSISERTVKHHLTNIFSKVGVSSRLQLAIFVNHHLMNYSPMPGLAGEQNSLVGDGLEMEGA